jgi:hypothetical protein
MKLRFLPELILRMHGSIPPCLLPIFTGWCKGPLQVSVLISKSTLYELCKSRSTDILGNIILEVPVVATYACTSLTRLLRALCIPGARRDAVPRVLTCPHSCLTVYLLYQIHTYE